VVARASWPDEEIVRCRLGDLASQVRSRGIRRTAIIVVGRILSEPGFDESHLYSAGRNRGLPADRSSR
jgi:precorrin-4/cobalt-precorrin-4 C11-methyltransferase